MNAVLRPQTMLAWIKVGALEDVPRLGARVVRSAHGDIVLELLFRVACTLL